MKQSYKRAQMMILQDKFKGNSQDFYRQLKDLLQSYLDFDCLTVETMQGKQLNMVITVSICQ